MAQGNNADFFSDRSMSRGPIKSPYEFTKDAAASRLGAFKNPLAPVYQPVKSALTGISDFGQQFGGMVKQKGLSGVVDQVGAAVTPAISQLGKTIQTGLGSALYGQGYKPEAATPQPEAKPEAKPEVKPAPTIRQPMGMVDLGGGSSITTNQPLSIDAMKRIQTAGVQSTPEDVARRARDVADVEASIAKYGTGREEMQPNMGMQRPVQQTSNQPDYSAEIEQALSVLNKPAASGSFDRMIGQKKERAAAQAVLNTLGGMQTAGNQQATQRDIAAMGNESELQRAEMANRSAQERTAAEQALGIAGLTSQDQERQSRMGLAKAQFDREGQLAEQGAEGLKAQRAAAMNFFNEKANEGIFGNEEAAQYAQLVGTGAMSPAEAFKLFNSKK